MRRLLPVLLMSTALAATASPILAQGKQDEGAGAKAPLKSTPPAKPPEAPDSPVDLKQPKLPQHSGDSLPTGTSHPDSGSKNLGGTEPAQPVWREWIARNLYRFEPAPVDASAAHSGLPPHLLDLSLRAEKRDLYRSDVETVLTRLLEDGDDRVRGAAALSLARVGLDPQSDRLLTLLADDHRRVRDQSLLAASLAEGSAARYHLLRFAAGESSELRAVTTDSERERVRALAAIFLAERREPSVPRLLGDWVADRTVASQHRALAIEALGLAGNPEAAERQIRGMLAWGLGPALRQAITVRNGAVEQSNFHDYEPIRMREFPRDIRLHFIQTDRWISGIGEEVVPLIAPALCNAIFAATGKRIRSLPIRNHDLSWA
jgi:hypothetical protein